MLAIIRQMFLKGKTIKDAIFYVFEQTGNMPTKSLGKKIIDIYKDVQKNTAKVFDLSGKRIDTSKPIIGGKNVKSSKKERIHRIDEELENLSKGEGKYDKMSRNDREDLMIKLQDESSTLQKTPGMAKSEFDDEFLSFKLNIAKNNPEFNQDLAKQIINREMFKDASTEQRKQVLDALDFVLKNPRGMASGGIARVGMFLGGPIVPIVKGGKWFLKALRDTRKLMTQNKQHSPEQLKYYLNQIDDQIKNIEAGGKIPDEVIQTIRKDPKFKSVSQKSANDPDLREIEEVLLEYGEKHASGGIAGQLHLNQGGRVSFVKGGKVSSGLAHILGV